MAEAPVLALKKLGGLFLVVIGLLLTAVGFSTGSTGVTVLGIILLAGGAILMVLKIVRRNQSSKL